MTRQSAFALLYCASAENQAESRLEPRGDSRRRASSHGVVDAAVALAELVLQLLRGVAEQTCSAGPPTLTAFSTFMSRNIGKAPYFRQIGTA